MSSGHHSWPDLPVQWVLEGHNEGLPGTLTEAIAAASGADLELLIDRLSVELAGGPEPLLEPAQPATSSTKSSPLVQRLRSILQLIAARALRLRLDQEPEDGDLLPSIEPDSLGQLAESVLGLSAVATAHCLQIMAAQGDQESLEVLCEFLKRQTLEDEQSVAVALSPLFQWPPPHLAHVFEIIGEDIWRWQLLGGLLDLAGHSFRKKKLAVHPLAQQAPRLRELLGSTTARLSRLEANPKQFGEDVATIQRVLNNAIALTVSLCDTLALIGDRQALGVLNDALELSHRRIQTEAAGALARLGDAAGVSRLKLMVQDPAARLRAISYLDELNIDDADLEDWRQPVSLAEAEVVCWLADSARFGVPPADLELVDERTQYWPSYESPQVCFLYRFTYHFAQGDLSNFIIAGPLVHAFQADLRKLELDDVYALFAGWQAEHDEIYEVPRTAFNPVQLQEAERLMDEPSHQGIEDLQALALTFFFGERAVLAAGHHHGKSVTVVSDGLETLVMPTDGRPTSLTPDLVLALYRGRKLLRSFNPT